MFNWLMSPAVIAVRVILDSDSKYRLSRLPMKLRIRKIAVISKDVVITMAVAIKRTIL